MQIATFLYPIFVRSSDSQTGSGIGLYLLSENRADQVGRVSHITGQQQRSFDAVDTAGSPEPVADDEQQQGQRGHHQHVPVENLRLDGHWTDRTSYAHHRQGVEQVGAQDVA